MLLALRSLRSRLTEDEGQGEALLILILALLVAVADATDRISAEEQNLRNAFTAVDLGGEGCRVADLDGHLAAPFRLQWGYITYYTTTRVSAFAQTDCDDIARDFEVLDRL